MIDIFFFFFFSSRRRHTRWTGDWSSDVCSSDLVQSGREQRPLLALKFPWSTRPDVPDQWLSEDYGISRHAGRTCPGQPHPPLGGRAFPWLCRGVRRGQREGLLVPRPPQWHHVRPLREGVEVGPSAVSRGVGAAGKPDGLGLADLGVR